MWCKERRRSRSPLNDSHVCSTFKSKVTLIIIICNKRKKVVWRCKLVAIGVHNTMPSYYCHLHSQQEPSAAQVRAVGVVQVLKLLLLPTTLSICARGCLRYVMLNVVNGFFQELFALLCFGLLYTTRRLKTSFQLPIHFYWVRTQLPISPWATRRGCVVLFATRVLCWNA